MNALIRILQYSKQYKNKIIISIVSASIYGMVAALPTLAIKYTVDDIFVKRLHHLIIPFLLAFILLFALKGLFMYLTTYYMQWVGNKVVNDIRRDLFDKMIFFPLSFFRKTTTGALMSHFLNDVQMIQNASSSAIKNGVRSIFEASAYIIIAFSLNWKLCLLMLVVGPVIGYTIKSMGTRIKAASRAIQAEMGKVSSILQESFIGIREIKAFTGEKVEGKRFSRQLDLCFNSIITNVRIDALLPAITEVIAMLGGSIAFYVAIQQVLHGSITPGQLTAFFAAVLLCYQPLKKIVAVYSEVQYGLAAAERVFAIMDQIHPALQSRHDSLENISGPITFENVSFSYNEQAHVFHNINLTIKKGECLGIVGPSGAGKSTLCDLLLGFLHPTSGRICVSDKDISKVSFNSLRNKIGYVSQRTFLFNDSIKHNVAYSLPNATEEEIIAACKVAHAHEFIQNIPGQYDALVGENGSLLSGGQKQRLTIARALLKDPDILIFDEPTSSLDQESEHLIQKAIAELSQEKTLIIVSHRATLLKNVDRILHIENNKIQEISKESYFEKQATH
ncbi:MAG: ABC transporter ATP-binding protein [bacterium]